jgi:hypothetical protein
MPKKGQIPPQFLKHPPKSWKGDMPEIRKEAKADKKKGGVRMSKKDRVKHKREPVFHVVPDLFYAGAAYELVGPALGNILEYRSEGLSGMLDPANVGYSVGMMTQNALPAAELAVTGIVIQKVAKWIGINRFGSKRIKVF